MRMAQNLILLPVFAQVLLAVLTMVVLIVRRQVSLKTRGKSVQDMADATDADWDHAAAKTSRNFKNQFELPVLFYAVTAFALVTRNVDLTFFVVASIFVASRYAHTGAHLFTDNVMVRGLAFIVGFVALIIMWIALAWRILVVGF